MDRCFVMQPFDKRFDDVFSPAINQAGLEPYRVDRDPSVSIPIDDIENGIRKSRICLADITTDNPNVWFELGFAIAVSKEVVLVCSDERTKKFPFDVQHRNIINYQTESPQDFIALKENILKRIQALLKKENEIGRFSSISVLKDTEGLSQHDIVCLVSVMQNCLVPDEGVSPQTVKDDMTKAGFTEIAASLGIRSLLSKGMIESFDEHDYEGNSWIVIRPTDSGIQWLMQNQEKILLKKEPDIPF